jgi:hypothetical protein
MPTETQYTLTDAERAGLQGLASQVSAGQLAVYQQNVALEALKEKLAAYLRDVDAANARFNGALSFLLSAHGWQSGQLSPDFATLTAAPGTPVQQPASIVPGKE